MYMGQFPIRIRCFPNEIRYFCLGILVGAVEVFAEMGYDESAAIVSAPKDFTKPQQTLQSPNRLYKAPETLHKHINIRQKALNTRQVPKIFNKSSNN